MTAELTLTAVRWLAGALVNGTAFAVLAWCASVTCLRSASGRVLSALWLAALAQFFWWRPIELPAQPLPAAVLPMLQPAEADRPSVWVLLYLTLVVGALARLCWRHLRLRRALQQLRAADAELLACVRGAANALSLRALPEVRVTDERVAPYSAGALRPILVLPRFICEPGARLHAVLLHELAHIARRDHAVLWFERAVRSLFFFWPPVHFISHKLGEARELACDEQAIARGGLCPVDYARLLVDVVALTRAPTGAEALAMGRGAWRLERRVERLLAESWSRPLRALQCAALLLLTAAALIGVRVEPWRAVSALPELALPACDGSAMSYEPEPQPSAACPEADSALQSGP